MANNYVSFANSFRFPEEAGKDAVRIFNACANSSFVAEVPEWWLLTGNTNYEEVALIKGGDAQAFEDFIEVNFGDFDENIESEYADGFLYVSSMGNANLDLAARVLSDVMKHYDVKQVVQIQGAYTCDKARSGEFGGFAVAVGPGQIRFTDSCSESSALGARIAESLSIPLTEPQRQAMSQKAQKDGVNPLKVAKFAYDAAKGLANEILIQIGDRMYSDGASDLMVPYGYDTEADPEGIVKNSGLQFAGEPESAPEAEIGTVAMEELYSGLELIMEKLEAEGDLARLVLDDAGASFGKAVARKALDAPLSNTDLSESVAEVMKAHPDIAGRLEVGIESVGNSMLVAITSWDVAEPEESESMRP